MGKTSIVRLVILFLVVLLCGAGWYMAYGTKEYAYVVIPSAIQSHHDYIFYMQEKRRLTNSHKEEMLAAGLPNGLLLDNAISGEGYAVLYQQATGQAEKQAICLQGLNQHLNQPILSVYEKSQLPIVNLQLTVLGATYTKESQGEVERKLHNLLVASTPERLSYAYAWPKGVAFKEVALYRGNFTNQVGMSENTSKEHVSDLAKGALDTRYNRMYADVVAIAKKIAKDKGYIYTEERRYEGINITPLVQEEVSKIHKET